MCENLHQTILYLLEDEYGDLKSKSQIWVGNMRG